MQFDQTNEKALFELTKQLAQFEINDFDELKTVELRKVLHYHEWKYYVQDNPVLSDFEYDQLYKLLVGIERIHSDWITSDSPTQRVGSDLTSDFPTVKHLVPMLSLDNSYNANDLKDFDAQIRKLCQLGPDDKIEYVVEPKFDGGSVAINYENDYFIRAATRGNGEEGDEITNNAKTIYSVPLSTKFGDSGIYKAELRGEAVIHKQKFDKINTAREKAGISLFANPRNAATGGLRMKDPKEVSERNLEIFVFQMGYAVDHVNTDQLPLLKTHYGTMNLLSTLGFKVALDVMKCFDSIEEVAKYCNEWESLRDGYPYEMDGMVIKVNSYKIQEKCGFTSHHPRWAIAYKFKAKQATSKLLKVEYQVGKIGTLTPVAKISPVELAGVTISSISLHNEEFIVGKDIRIGDQVLVERAGDVIPYIVKSLPELRDGTEAIISFPKTCPSCDSELKKMEDEAAWRCINPECPAQLVQRLIHHVSKDAMDMDGFGKSIVERFCELGWIKSVVDIYKLDYDAIAKLEGFGEKSARKIEESVIKAKNNPIHRLLYSLSIHHLGKKASKILAGRINHILELKNWSIEDFTNIHEIGPVVANNVSLFFADEMNRTILMEMESLGVNMNALEDDKPLVVDENAVLMGKTILFTGKLLQMTRKQAQKLAESLGAKNISAVSSNLDILVVGEKAGSKLKKANALGTVAVWTEQEFLNKIEEK